MADKSKKKTEKKAPGAEEKAAPALAAPPTPAPLPRRGRNKPRAAQVSALASVTRTTPLVLAALKTAYGWTDRTRLTRREFLRKRDEWLARPASEV